MRPIGGIIGRLQNFQFGADRPVTNKALAAESVVAKVPIRTI
jgi:hypothetical protein